ncbi:hypothetical protein QUA00_27420 [Microcoleus sp. T2B6]
MACNASSQKHPRDSDRTGEAKYNQKLKPSTSTNIGIKILSLQILLNCWV